MNNFDFKVGQSVYMVSELWNLSETNLQPEIIKEIDGHVCTFRSGTSCSKWNLYPSIKDVYLAAAKYHADKVTQYMKLIQPTKPIK